MKPLILARENYMLMQGMMTIILWELCLRKVMSLLCPNSQRWRGFHRKKARKLYNKFENRLGYRQGGRGESVFGSLTNYFGDRFKTINLQVTKTRTAVRVLVYQIKLLMRLIQKFFRNYLDTLLSNLKIKI